jgi:exo-1,4-beta-D-glucosaminidase
VALLASCLAAGCGAEPAPEPATEREHRLDLAEGWRIQAAADVEAGGALVSAPGFPTAGWYPARVPTTVLAALVADGAYTDPYFGKNLEKIPRERFEGPWWYRRELSVDRGEPGTRYRLDFHGINYRAEVWLNGERVADAEEIVGAYRRFRLDVTDRIVAGVNVLAVEVFPPRPGDFTVGFVDWNPTAPDRNMGLWRGVELRVTRGVSLDDVFVRTDVDLETMGEARLTVAARLANPSAEAVSGSLRGAIEGRRFETPYSLAAGEVAEVELSPAEHPALVVAEPRLWWPHTLGEPVLYDLDLEVTAGEAVSDAARVRFGIREVEDYLNEQGHRGYRINGREVLVRGGGWVDDLMLREDPRKVEDQLLYVKHLNLDAIRLEGFWGSGDTLYDLADEHGILVMPGWSCQWEWQEYLGVPVDEFGGIDTDEELELVARSLADQVAWLRNHPSIFVWVLASDMLPRPRVEERYRADLAVVDPTRPLLAACSVRDSEVSGPTGVKMNGPYDYVPPVYWYVDRERGGAYGFNTETGPGPQPPPLESVRKMIPAEHLWPIDEMWEYHCGRNEFDTLDRFREALDRRYGPSDGVEEFLRKSQVASYEAMRPMFEAFAVNRPETTGIVQWMLNSAWPEMYWQLYDYYLMPNGAFYGARTAGEPLDLVYHYGERAVYAVNNTLEPAAGLTAEIRVLDLDSRVVHSETMAVETSPGRAARVTSVPSAPSPVYFLDLRLRRPDGAAAGGGFYWLSAAEDVLDETGSTWFYTPIAEHADFTSLARLPTAPLEVSARLGEPDGPDGLLEATLRNPGDSLAFFVELRVVDAETGESLLPVFWEDNYVSLLPGEERTLSARFRRASPDREVELAYSGWNVDAATATPSGGTRAGAAADRP